MVWKVLDWWILETNSELAARNVANPKLMPDPLNHLFQFSGVHVIRYYFFQGRYSHLLSISFWTCSISGFSQRMTTRNSTKTQRWESKMKQREMILEFGGNVEGNMRPRCSIHDMYFTQIIVVSTGGRKILFKRVFKGIDGESSLPDKVLHCCLANLQEFINSKRSQTRLRLSTIIVRMNEVVKGIESSNRLTIASHGFYQFACYVHMSWKISPLPCSQVANPY